MIKKIKAFILYMIRKRWINQLTQSVIKPSTIDHKKNSVKGHLLFPFWCFHHLGLFEAHVKETKSINFFWKLKKSLMVLAPDKITPLFSSITHEPRHFPKLNRATFYYYVTFLLFLLLFCSCYVSGSLLFPQGISPLPTLYRSNFGKVPVTSHWARNFDGVWGMHWCYF